VKFLIAQIPKVMKLYHGHTLYNVNTAGIDTSAHKIDVNLSSEKAIATKFVKKILIQVVGKLSGKVRYLLLFCR
jgi:hypothetical protein